MNKPIVIATIAAILLLIAAPAGADAGIIRKSGAKLAFTSAGQDYELTFAPDNETERRFGVGAGAFIEWFDLPVFSLITQVEYLPRGMKQEFNVTGPDGPEILGTSTIENRLDYISIPVLAKARLDLGSFSPYVLSGFRFDYLLGFESEDGVYDPLYSRFDRSILGCSVAAGVETGALLPVGLLAEIRYNFDLNDSYATDVLTVSNNAIDLWLGVTF